MLSKDQIEELGWVAVENRNFFLFESDDEQYRNWEMRVSPTPGEFVIFPVMRDGKAGNRMYNGGVDDQMELYDIMAAIGVLPKEE